MKISLQITAFDRQADLDRFAASIHRQTFQGSIETVYVAQGTAKLHLTEAAGRIAVKTISAGRRMPISEARNLAVAHATGDILAFPDDDCWYPDDLLEKVAGYFAAHPEVDCVCTSVYDPIRNASFGRRPRGVIRRITYVSLFQLPISVGIFVRREAFFATGGAFSEELGAGAFIGSGEETEMIGRLLCADLLVHYVGTIEVYHPVPLYVQDDSAKSYRYAIGFGYLNVCLIRKRHYAVIPYLLKFVVRSCGGILVHLLSPVNRSVYLSRLSGIGVGLFYSFVGIGKHQDKASSSQGDTR
jgi:glycosyltransferase involved in cell wall biosynthesis